MKKHTEAVKRRRQLELVLVLGKSQTPKILKVTDTTDLQKALLKQIFIYAILIDECEKQRYCREIDFVTMEQAKAMQAALKTYNNLETSSVNTVKKIYAISEEGKTKRPHRNLMSVIPKLRFDVTIDEVSYGLRDAHLDIHCQQLTAAMLTVSYENVCLVDVSGKICIGARLDYMRRILLTTHDTLSPVSYMVGQFMNSPELPSVDGKPSI